MIYSFCLLCGRWLPCDSFNRRKNRTGRYPYCRQCASAKSYWRQIELGTKKEWLPTSSRPHVPAEHECGTCGKTKRYEEFATRWQCLDCFRKRTNRYYNEVVKKR